MKHTPEAESGLAARYSADAPAYERLWAPVLLPYSREMIDALPLATARRILDLGAGTGALVGEIGARAPGATIIAADRSGGMLARAPSSCRRVVTDACQLGLATGCIDAAVVAFMLFHLREPSRALVETRRVLRRGGAIGTTTWSGPANFAARNAWNEELDGAGAPPVGDDPTDHRSVDSEAKVAALLKGAGFGSIRTWDKPFVQQYHREELILRLTSMGGERHRLAALGPLARARFLGRARSRLEAMKPEDFIDRATIFFATAGAI